jgi:hypothetical protein
MGEMYRGQPAEAMNGVPLAWLALFDALPIVHNRSD